MILFQRFAWKRIRICINFWIGRLISIVVFENGLTVSPPPQTILAFFGSFTEAYLKLGHGWVMTSHNNGIVLILEYLISEISLHGCGRHLAWWRHQMETFSALLALCAGNSPVNSPHKGQWRGALDVFFDVRLNKRLSKQSWGWWSKTRSLWRHCNGFKERWDEVVGTSPHHIEMAGLHYRKHYV